MKRVRLIPALVVFVPVTAVVSFCAVDAVRHRQENAFRYLIPEETTFSPEAWARSPDTRRLAMARDFLYRHSVRGMSIEDVVTQLGEPAQIYDVWSYALSAKGGPPPKQQSDSIRVEYPALVVCFDRKGHVGNVETTLDTTPDSGLAFSSDRWRQGAPSERCSMARQLIESGQLHGHTKGTVLGILGQADTESEHLLITYKVGETSADYMMLEFAVDADGKVVKVRIYQS